MKKLTIEQKAYDEAIKVGDWVVYDHRPYQVVELPKECYINLGLRGNGKIEFAPSTYCRHWTIQDANDGDVLFTSSTASHETFIFKSIDEKGNAKCYFAYDSEDGFREGVYHFIGRATNCKPATKEQCELLFQKMKEAGYEWDANKKELKKIEQKPTLEDAAKAFLEALSETPYNNTPIVEAQIITKQLLIFLSDPKSYNPDAINEQKPAEWSEEDEKKFSDILAILRGGENCYYNNPILIDWLKSLKGRVQPQPKQEWSEEDKQAIEDAETWLDTLCDYLKDCSSECILTVKNVISKLKSIRPQNTWKPSDEQMVALDGICSYIRNKADWEISQDMIYELYKLSEQLKKLREK